MATLRQASEMQKEEEYFDKKRLAAEHITLCLRGAELVDNKFDKGAFQWEVPYFAVAGGKRLTGKLWFVSTTHDARQLPTSWDVLFGNTTDWPGHNIQIAFNGFNADATPNIQRGYHFEFLNVADSECPCRHFNIVSPHKQEALPAPTAAGLLVDKIHAAASVHDVPGIIEATLNDADVFSPEGVNYADPISQATQAKILKATTQMMATHNTRVDPGDFDRMTEGDGQRMLDTLRAQWLAASAAKIKTTL